MAHQSLNTSQDLHLFAFLDISNSLLLLLGTQSMITQESKVGLKAQAQRLCPEMPF